MEAIELLKNKFGVQQKYLYELKDGDETILEIYWHPLTLAERESIIGQSKNGLDSSNDEFAFKLDAGQSFILCGDNSTGMELIFNATENADSATHTALGPLTAVTADAESSTVEIEMFVATTQWQLLETKYHL